MEYTSKITSRWVLLLLKWLFLCWGTPLAAVRLESQHAFHSGTCPHLIGKVLVIAPDSHFGLVEFHTVSVSSASCGLWTLLLWCTTAAVSLSHGCLCSSQKNGCPRRALHERNPCQNLVSGELFAIAFPSDVLLKGFLLEQLILF